MNLIICCLYTVPLRKRSKLTVINNRIWIGIEDSGFFSFILFDVFHRGHVKFFFETSAEIFGIGESGLLEIEAVRIPCSRAFRKAPIT